MLGNGPRHSQAATCEDWDEDAEKTLPDTRTSANVAAKRWKPEGDPTKSRARHTPIDGDTAKMSRTQSTNTQGDGPVKKEKKSAGLKLDTSFPQRESRPYSSGPPKDRPRRNSGRPTTAKQPVSKTEKSEPFRHREECWVCDAYGHHVMLGLDAHGGMRGQSVPPSPITMSHLPPDQPPPPTTQVAEAPTARPRSVRIQSFREPRPTSYHGAMSSEAYFPGLSQSFPTEWNTMPLTPMSPYGQLPYAPTPTMNLQNPYQDFSQPFHMPFNPQAPAPSRSRPVEPQRRASIRGEPIISQAPIPDQAHLTRKTSQRESRHSREPSRSREEDARRMPPPQFTTVPRRPSLAKANTTTTHPVSRRESVYHGHGSKSVQVPYKEPRSDRPPSSYRDRASSTSYTTRERPTPARTPTSFDDTKSTRKTDSCRPDVDKRVPLSNSERKEAEAEAYQRARGTKDRSLTVDAMRNFSRHSDSGSQRSKNSSSKSSSASKTKATVDDITVAIGGLTLGISGDSAENRSINIRPKRGGLSISVDEHEPKNKSNKTSGLLKRSDSTTSSSRQSHRSSEKEVRRLRATSSDSNHDPPAKASNETGKPFLNDSLGYGVGYG